MKREVRTLFIQNDESVKESPVTKRFLKAFPKAAVHYVAKQEDIDSIEPPSYERAKRSIFLTENKGAFFRQCPGTKEFICCNYFVIDFAFQCPFECRYCFLNFYDNAFLTIIYTNVDKIIDEVRTELIPNKFYRIGTGELTDSLVYDELTGVSEKLIELFKGYERIYLELKTKSANVEHIIKIADKLTEKEKRKIVIAFSVSPQKLIDKYEPGTSSLEERVRAAEAANAAGFKLAFHFDPMFNIDDFEAEYKSCVDSIYKGIEKGSVYWISMGGVRFMERYFKTFAGSDEYSFLLDEFVECPDAKMRYFYPIRKEMYQKLLKFIRRHDDMVYVYLCMESARMWKDVMGRSFNIRHFQDAISAVSS